MHYRISIFNRFVLFPLLIAVSVLIAIIVFGAVEYKQTQLELQQKIQLLLEQSINEEVKLKMEGEYVSANTVNEPVETNERVRNQTIITEDTIITKEFEDDKDFNNQLLKTSQTFLLYMKRLQPDTLQQIFQSKLEANGIKAHAVMLVRHSQIAEMSGDTTQYRISYRTPLIKGGALEEITYEALLSYGPITLFRLMPKRILRVLIIIEALALVFAYFTFIQKRKISLEKSMPDEIMPEKSMPNRIMKHEKHFYIGNTFFDTIRNELITGEKAVNVPNQPAGLLLMFVESKDHAVKKDAILEKFWPKSHTAYDSMTSAINKLRSLLKEADCDFTVATKKLGDHYMLKYRRNVKTNKK